MIEDHAEIINVCFPEGEEGGEVTLLPLVLMLETKQTIWL